LYLLVDSTTDHVSSFMMPFEMANFTRAVRLWILSFSEMFV